MLSFDGGPKRADLVRQIKRWAAEVLGLPPDASILVSELTCTEPGCPPLETVVAVLRGPGDQQQFKIHRPLLELTRQDLVEAFELHPGHGHPAEPPASAE